MQTEARHPARAPAFLLGCFLLAVVLVLAIDEPDRSPDRAPRVVRVDSSAVLVLPSRQDPRLILADSHELSPGQFVTAAPGPGAPSGFLLKVRSSSVAAGRTFAIVEPGSLYEAVPNGALVANPGDFEVAAVEEGSGQREPANVFARFSTVAAGDESGLTASPLGLALPCERGAGITVTPTPKAELRPHFDLRWSKRGVSRWSIESASAGLIGEVSAAVVAEAAGRVECTPDPWLLAEPGFTGVVTVGGVPVPVRVSVPLQLSATVEASVAIKASARAGADAFVGLEYQGRRVKPSMIFEPSASLEEPRIAAQASAGLSVRPAVKIEAGWKVRGLGGVAAAAQLELNTGVRLTYVAGRQPPAKACFPVSLGGRFIFTLPFRPRLEKPLPDLMKRRKCIDVS